MHSSAKMGLPAATEPTNGTWSRRLWQPSVMVMARVFPSAWLMSPASRRPFRWKCTVEGDLSPTCWAISRTEGGYPFSWAKDKM